MFQVFLQTFCNITIYFVWFVHHVQRFAAHILSDYDLHLGNIKKNKLFLFYMPFTFVITVLRNRMQNLYFIGIKSLLASAFITYNTI